MLTEIKTFLSLFKINYLCIIKIKKIQEKEEKSGEEKKKEQNENKRPHPALYKVSSTEREPPP